MRLTAVILSVLHLFSVTQRPGPEEDGCRAPDAAIAIDHVVLAVPDLAAATAEFAALGFTVKPGRIHRDGLLNAHLKFGDGTEIELMTVVADASGGTAREYARLIESGGGGAFLALGASRTAALAAAADSDIDAHGIDASPFRYVAFADQGMASVFVIEYEHRSAEAREHLDHRNGAEGIGEVWVEAGEGLAKLLGGLGAQRCGPASGPNGEVGAALAVRNGTVVVVDAPSAVRPRVLGVRVRSGIPASRLVHPQQANGLWLTVGDARP